MEEASTLLSWLMEASRTLGAPSLEDHPLVKYHVIEDMDSGGDRVIYRAEDTRLPVRVIVRGQHRHERLDLLEDLRPATRMLGEDHERIDALTSNCSDELPADGVPAATDLPATSSEPGAATGSNTGSTGTTTTGN